MDNIMKRKLNDLLQLYTMKEEQYNEFFCLKFKDKIKEKVNSKYLFH